MNLNIFQYNQDKLTLQYAFNSWGLTQVRFKALAYQDLNSIISLLEGQSMFISFIQFSAAKVVSELEGYENPQRDLIDHFGFRNIFHFTSKMTNIIKPINNIVIFGSPAASHTKVMKKAKLEYGAEEFKTDRVKAPIVDADRSIQLPYYNLSLTDKQREEVAARNAAFEARYTPPKHQNIRKNISDDYKKRTKLDSWIEEVGARTVAIRERRYIDDRLEAIRKDMVNGQLERVLSKAVSFAESNCNVLIWTNICIDGFTSKAQFIDRDCLQQSNNFEQLKQQSLEYVKQAPLNVKGPRLNDMMPLVSRGSLDKPTNQDKVFECLDNKGTQWKKDIALETGLTELQVTNAIQGLRQKKQIVKSRIKKDSRYGYKYRINTAAYKGSQV